MEQKLEHTIALLARTPATLDALLRDLPEAWTLSNEGGSTWSPCVVVAHLIQGERQDWLPRVRVILDSGETREFDPFEREGHVRYGQGKTLAQLLDALVAYCLPIPSGSLGTRKLDTVGKLTPLPLSWPENVETPAPRYTLPGRWMTESR